ncbi:Uncharacterized protein FKW44_020889, partial [Caligus rogercresseyi]
MVSSSPGCSNKWSFFGPSYSYICVVYSGFQIPFAATYTNVSGGADEDLWRILYNCDSGYELFGEKGRDCEDGVWVPEDLPLCSINVARNKPANASSVSGGGLPGNAVDGRSGTVHEGNKCTETLSEKSPWWTVDLLRPHTIKYIRLTTRCCDDN